MIDERAKEHRNWMEEWWLRTAYLMTRETFAVHVNWFGVFPDWGVKLTSVQAAALMMVSTLEFKQALDRQELPPEMMRGAPLCMDQYSRIFGTTRVPQEGEDVIETHSDSRHVVIFRDDHVFSVTPYHPDGSVYSVPEAAALLQAVLDASSSVLEEREEPSVSVLTSMERDRWAAVRADMMERSAVNRASIREIETAMYCLSFEDASPTSKQEVAGHCLAGDGRNKWFDKSFTTLVFDNGRGGCNAEHSPVDAMVCVSMFDYVVKRTRDKVIADKAHLFEPLPRGSVQPPTKLKWEMWPALSMSIETASVELMRLISDVSLGVFKFKHFGKAFIKRYKLHPVRAPCACVRWLVGARRHPRAPSSSRRPPPCGLRAAPSPGLLRADGDPARVLPAARRGGRHVRDGPHARLLPWAHRDDPHVLGRVCGVRARHGEQRPLERGQVRGAQGGDHGARRVRDTRALGARVRSSFAGAADCRLPLGHVAAPGYLHRHGVQKVGRQRQLCGVDEQCGVHAALRRLCADGQAWLRRVLLYPGLQDQHLDLVVELVCAHGLPPLWRADRACTHRPAAAVHHRQPAATAAVQAVSGFDSRARRGGGSVPPASDSRLTATGLVNAES